MTPIKFIFKAIDVLYENIQNTRKDTRDPEHTVTEEHDLIYDESCPDACRMDLFHIPRADNEKYPVVLYIHGGAWEAGDKKYRVGISRWYALKGWYVVNINYGLSPEYKFPHPMRHVVSAYNWIVDNAEKLHFDLNNIIVTGDSAGAYFALMVAAIDRNPVMQERLGCATKAPVQGVVLDCGMYDLRFAFVTKRIVLDMGNLLLKDFIEADRIEFDDNQYADVLSPIDYITEDFPPCFVAYSKKDVFCGGQGELLEMELSKKGVYYNAYRAKLLKDNHCFPINTRGKATREHDLALIDFLNRFTHRDTLKNWQDTENEECSRRHKDTRILEKRARQSLRHAKHRARKLNRKFDKYEAKSES